MLAGSVFQVSVGSPVVIFPVVKKQNKTGRVVINSSEKRMFVCSGFTRPLSDYFSHDFLLLSGLTVTEIFPQTKNLTRLWDHFLYFVDLELCTSLA